MKATSSILAIKMQDKRTWQLENYLEVKMQGFFKKHKLQCEWFPFKILQS